MISNKVTTQNNSNLDAICDYAEAAGSLQL